MTPKLFIAIIVILLLGAVGWYHTPQDQKEGAAPPVLKVQQGGTGAATFTSGQCLKGNGTGPLTTGACGSGGSADDPFTHPSAGVSATTSKMLLLASSTIGDGTQIGGLTISGWSTTTGAILVQSAATSTFTGGVNLNGTDCFAISGTCLQTFIQAATAYKSAANYATAAVLAGTPTYANGTNGVGATLTEVGFGALAVDGAAPTVGQRILVKNQADQTQNGVYTVTVVGSGIASYVLTRSTDFNTTNDIYAGVTVPVLVGGTANGDTSWVESTTGNITVGSSNIAFIESSIGTAADTFAWPFTSSTQYAQTVSGTSTALYLTGSPISLMASSTSIFDLASTTAASSTRLTVGTQWFTGLFSGELAVDANGKVYKGATSTLSTISGSLDLNAQVGSSRLPFANLTQIAANNVLGNNTSATADVRGVATSTFFGVTTNGFILAAVNGSLQMVATTTFTGTAPIALTYAAGQVTGSCTNASAGVTGCLTGSDWSTFNNKFGAYDAWTHNNATQSATTSAIGIGTTTPFSQLSVSTSTASAPTTSLFVVASSTNATLLNVLGSGKVGIGTTTPWALLSINSDGTNAPFTIGSSTGALFTVGANGTIQLSAQQPGTSTTITMNWATSSPQVEYQIGTAATTITITNAAVAANWGSRKLVWVCNPGNTAGALTWVGVEWIGTAPVQTATANQCDVYSFDITRATSTSGYKVSGTAGTGFQ